MSKKILTLDNVPVINKKIGKIDTIEKLKASTIYSLGDVVEVLGFHAKGDGSHHKRVAKGENDGSGEQGQGGIWWCIVHSGEVNVSWFGIENESRNLSSELNTILNNINFKKVNFDKTNLYLEVTKAPNIAININRNDLVVDFKGSSLYPENESVWRLLNLSGCKNIEIKNLTSLGYYKNGYNYTTSGERYSCISLSDSCENIEIYKCRIDNYLGDCIYLGTSLSDGSIISPSKNVKIHDNYLKERYGNGIRTWDGGSRSRLAIAVVDVDGLIIENNIIAGTVDLEPNTDGQSIANVCVRKNKFICKRPIEESGEYVEEKFSENIESQFVVLTGRPGLPVVKNNYVLENYGESLTVSMAYKYIFSEISKNDLGDGKIKITASCSSAKINENKTTGSLIESVELRPDDNILVDNFFSGNMFSTFFERKPYRFERNFITINKNIDIDIPTPELNTVIGYGKTSNNSTKSKTFVRNNFVNFGSWTNQTDIILSAGEIVSSMSGLLAHEVGTVVNFYARTGTAACYITTQLPYGETKLELKLGQSASFVRIGGALQLIATSGTFLSTYNLDTPYYTLKMQQEGIYEDYVAYRDELHEYENSQVADETMLLPALQEPEIPESVRTFAEKYKLI